MPGKNSLVIIFLICLYLIYCNTFKEKFTEVEAESDHEHKISITPIKKEFELLNKKISKLEETYVNSYSPKELTDAKNVKSESEAIIKSYIRNIYDVNMEAIQNLQMIAAALQSNDGLNLPGSLTIQGDLKVNKDISGKDIKAANISAANNISGKDIKATNNISVKDIKAANISAANNISGKDIKATNNISAANNISATNEISGDVVRVDNNMYAGNLISGKDIQASEDITGNNVRGSNVYVADKNLKNHTHRYYDANTYDNDEDKNSHAAWRTSNGFR